MGACGGELMMIAGTRRGDTNAPFGFVDDSLRYIGWNRGEGWVVRDGDNEEVATPWNLGRVVLLMCRDDLAFW